MYKNEDRALNPVELTHEELSLASGGYYPGYYYYGGYDYDKINQAQASLQNQMAKVGHAYHVSTVQAQVSGQSQNAVTH